MRPRARTETLVAMVCAAGIVLAVALLRKSEAADAQPVAELAPSVTPRPAPLRAADEPKPAPATL